MIIKRSKSKRKLERELDKIIKQSKITSWKQARSKDAKYDKEPWTEKLGD